MKYAERPWVRKLWEFFIPQLLLYFSKYLKIFVSDERISIQLPQG